MPAISETHTVPMSLLPPTRAASMEPYGRPRWPSVRRCAVRERQSRFNRAARLLVMLIDSSPCVRLPAPLGPRIRKSHPTQPRTRRRERPAARRQDRTGKARREPRPFEPNLLNRIYWRQLRDRRVQRASAAGNWMVGPPSSWSLRDQEGASWQARFSDRPRVGPSRVSRQSHLSSSRAAGNRLRGSRESRHALR